MPFNLPGIYLGLYAALWRPALLRPTLVVDEYSDIPWRNLHAAIHQAEAQREAGRSESVSYIALDKDNCFSRAKTLDILPAYAAAFREMTQTLTSRSQCLIVSNTAGTLMHSEDLNGHLALQLERTTGFSVLRHKRPKPGCGNNILRHFSETHMTTVKPHEILVVGDRLLTDILMANLHGMRSCWLRKGVAYEDSGLGGKLERLYARMFL
ncbi:hypothetical protein PYCC9005_001082 [Savitreella phatthalungensis]